RRKPAAAAELVVLADHLALPVLEMLPRTSMNFPTDHPLYLGVERSARLDAADLVLIIDCDVPWIPSASQPPAAARIIHLDVDPLKEDLPLVFFPAHLSARADAAATLPRLRDEVRRGWTSTVADRVHARRQATDRAVRRMRRDWRSACASTRRRE